MVAFSQSGAEPPGYRAYAYLLFAYAWNPASKQTGMQVPERVASSYRGALEALDVLWRQAAASEAAATEPDRRHLLFCVPGRSRYRVVSLDDYGERLSIDYLRRLETALPRGRAEHVLLRRPGPHLVLSPRPLTSLRGDSDLLLVDLTDADPGTFLPLLLTVAQEANTRQAGDGPILAALRERLAPLAPAAGFALAFVHGAVID